MSTFDSTKTPLPDMIRQITEGKVQLPDFQRGWVWDDDHVRSLLVSVARSFPVGAVMLLETGGDVRFQVRPIENLEFSGTTPKPEKLILDGQQRLTSLTQVLTLDKKPVKTFNEKGKLIERYYYIDIDMALEEDRLDEAFIAVEKSRTTKKNFGREIDLDLSTRQKECEQLYFPCNQILNYGPWLTDLHKYNPEKVGLFLTDFLPKIINAFNSYQIPVISLGRSTSKEAVCLVFEKVNTGGVPLSVFELVTASFAADSFNLRDDWYGSSERKVNGRLQNLKVEPILDGVEPTDFLQAISLLHTQEKRRTDIAAGKTGKSISAVSAKRVSVLSLTLENYQKWADAVEYGFLEAAKFLHKECFFDARDLPYRTQIVPLAAVLSQLKERWREPKIHEKICQWYWCGVLGELYGGAVETRIANDLEELLAWIDGEDVQPRTIYEAAFQEGRLDTLRSRNSAAYKGLNVLVLREGATDFFWKATIQELNRDGVALDIHHIFPKAWCEDQGITPNVFNSIINKTPISYKANRMIGRKAPSSYLDAIQTHTQVGLDDDSMGKILQSHLIEPQTLRTDDFALFYARRKEKLLEITARAMGKTIEKDDSGYSDNEED
ncbi:MAG: DUF262 domain-containing protein [Thiolinea sp.]